MYVLISILYSKTMYTITHRCFQTAPVRSLFRRLGFEFRWTLCCVNVQSVISAYIRHVIILVKVSRFSFDNFCRKTAHAIVFIPRYDHKFKCRYTLRHYACSHFTAYSQLVCIHPYSNYRRNPAVTAVFPRFLLPSVVYRTLAYS